MCVRVCGYVGFKPPLRGRLYLQSSVKKETEAVSYDII